MNLSVRFYNMSFSLNKVSIKDYIDYDRMVIHPEAPIRDASRCGVPQLLEVFNMNHTTIPFHLVGTFLLNKIQHEWGTFMNRALWARDDVLAWTRERLARLTTTETKAMDLLDTRTLPNIIDAFHVIDRREFPYIWRFLIRVLTIIPTTVACVQSFSYFKRTIHTNIPRKRQRFS